jgi:hypothetical protein
MKKALVDYSYFLKSWVAMVVKDLFGLDPVSEMATRAIGILAPEQREGWDLNDPSVPLRLRSRRISSRRSSLASSRNSVFWGCSAVV